MAQYHAGGMITATAPKLPPRTARTGGSQRGTAAPDTLIAVAAGGGLAAGIEFTHAVMACRARQHAAGSNDQQPARRQLVRCTSD